MKAGFGISGTWPMRTERSGGFGRRTRTPSPPASSSSAASGPQMRRLRRGASLLPRSRPNCPWRSHICSGQHRARGPRSGRHRARHGRLHALRQGARRRRQAAVGARGLALINQTLDEALAEQEGDFDADSRWALAWFEQSRLCRGRVRRGRAALQGQEHERRRHGRGRHPRVEARQGAAAQARGAARRLGPATDTRLTAWEIVHHLIRALEAGGEARRGALVAKLGEQGRDRPRAGLSPLHALRAQEVRGGGALLQRPRPELAGDRPARPREPASRAGTGRPVRSDRGVSRWPSPTTTASARRSTCCSDGLAPFVERELKPARAEAGCDGRRDAARPTTRARAQQADRAVGRRGAAQADVGDRGTTVFRKTLGPGRAQPGQRAARRAATSGRTRSRSPSDDAYRALDSMARLLTAVSAPQADEVEQDEAGAAPADLRRAGAQREAQGRRLADRERGRRAR